MSQEGLNRRSFNRLAAAAFGGMMTGAAIGCRQETAPNGASSNNDAVAAGEKHLCRGLNDCRGQGFGGANECRGQGQCATYERHSCAGENACKGQGGCGENPGLNSCKGQGGCAVPLMESAWEIVRARKEQEWKANNAPFGEAPPATN